MEAVQDDLTTYLSCAIAQKSVIGPESLRKSTQRTLPKPVLLAFRFINAVSVPRVSDLRVVDIQQVARPKSCMRFLLFYARYTTSPL